MSDSKPYFLIGLRRNGQPYLKNLATNEAFEKNIKEASLLIILCELNQNEKAEAIPRQNLYGIELAIKLRNEGLNILNKAV